MLFYIPIFYSHERCMNYRLSFLDQFKQQRKYVDVKLPTRQLDHHFDIDFCANLYADECYSGPDEGRYDEDGDAEQAKCLDSDANICNAHSQYCAGEDHANYIYTILSKSHTGILRIE